MKESPVEKRFKQRFEAHGFKVLKLTTPGTAGVMDRMILRPVWSPGAPFFTEMKRPGKDAERLQELMRENWLLRGVIVTEVCDSYEKVDELLAWALGVCNYDLVKDL